jgi:HEAT repeat protein
LYLSGEAAISLAKIGGAKELMYLHEALSGVNCFSSENLVRAIALIGTEDAENILIECIISKKYSEEVIRYSIKMLEELKLKRAFPYIVDCLKHPNRIIRENAIRAITSLNPSEAYTKILYLLEYDVDTVVEEAILALGEIGNSDALPYLRKLLPPRSLVICQALDKAMPILIDSNKIKEQECND